MRTLTVRGVDDQVYETLRDLAKRNHRSMQEQVKMILEREVALARGSHLSQCLLIRDHLEGREWGDVPADIRRDRER